MRRIIRKFAQNRHTDRQTENSKPEATLIPVDRRGERANYFYSILWAFHKLCNRDGISQNIIYAYEGGGVG